MQTAGWDTICGLGIERVNRSLAAERDALPSRFEIESEPDSPLAYRVEGELGAWRVVPGGGGALLHLELPIASGSFRSGRGAAARKSDLGGLAVRVEVSLQLLPDGEDGARALRFHFAAVGPAPDAGPKAAGAAPDAPQAGLVTPLQVVDPQSRLPAAHKALLPTLLATHLVEHRDAVGYRFARVNLVSPDSGSWLAPAASQYAYLETSGGAQLTILSVCDARDPAGLPRDFDPGVRVAENDGFFLLSKALLLEKLILPLLPGCYGKGVTARHFRYDAGAGVIRNAKRLPTKPVKSGLITYQPALDALCVDIEGDHLRADASGSCDLGLGIRMTFAVTSRNRVGFDAKTRRLSFAADPKPTRRHDVSIPWYAYATGFVTLLAPLIMSIVVPIIANDIATQLSTRLAAAPPLDESPWVHWGDLREMTVTAAGLRECLFVSGVFDA